MESSQFEGFVVTAINSTLWPTRPHWHSNGQFAILTGDCSIADLWQLLLTSKIMSVVHVNGVIEASYGVTLLNSLY